MTALEPIYDPEGDAIELRERLERRLEQASASETWLDINPIEHCRECGYLKREIRTGHWACPCDGWSAAA